MVSFLRYLKGYVRIRVWGLSPERFLNLCSNKGILLWDIAQEDGYLSMCISISGFRRLLPIARKTGTRAAIVEKVGLPFFMPGMWRRKAFLVGFLLCLLFWILSSFFIWDIQVSGNTSVTEEAFTDWLKGQGVYVGMRRADLDIESLEKAIRSNFPVVTWTSAKTEGTRLFVEIKENEVVALPVSEETRTGMDLIAPCSGTVTSLIVRAGVPKVSVGDTVEEGQVLVEGKVPVYNDDGTVREYRYVEADGDIYLTYQDTFQIELSADYVQKEYTGRSCVRYYLRLGEHTFMPGGEVPFLVYDSITREQTPAWFDKLSIPVFLGVVSSREYLNVEHIYTAEEAEELLDMRMSEFFASLEEKGVQIITKDVTIEESGGGWVMEAVMTLCERVFVQAETVVEETDLAGEESLSAESAR